jgi:predicted nucleotidyltransferase
LESFLERLIAEFKPLRVIIVGSLAKKKFIRGLSDIDILVVVNYEVLQDKRFILTSLKRCRCRDNYCLEA